MDSMMTPSKNKPWLDKVIEDTLEPELPICDPHHHLWEFRHDRVAPKYLLDEILSDLNSGHNIVSTVFIECSAMYRASGPEHMKCVGETEFVNGIAAMSASGLYGKCRVATAIVGSANLNIGSAVGEVLDAHVQAGGGRFRGIRCQGQWDADNSIRSAKDANGPDRFSNAKFREGFAELAPRNMTFEAWCYHTQLKEVTALARAFPDTTIILNHFGGPLGIGPYAGKADDIFPIWQKEIADLATCQNVLAKLGGINMDINGFGWENHNTPPTSETLMQATRRWYEHTIEHFGTSRCMFESNFPVDMTSCSYNTLWNSFKHLTLDYSVDEKRQLFHDTAVRTYKIN
ncbi:MAG: amidohydrolase family protein [Alphaproteobacteria bacterium]